MRAKVISGDENNGLEFKVRRMTYTEVIVNNPGERWLHNYKYSEVILISEGEIDDFLIKNREFLKIKLKRGISIFLYKALKDSLEDELNEEIKNLNLLRDKYNVNKKGIWSKEIICIPNNKIPIMVNAMGKNYKRNDYDILITPIPEEDFLEAAEKEVNRISREIKRRESIMASYLEAINVIKNRAIFNCKKP